MAYKELSSALETRIFVYSAILALGLSLSTFFSCMKGRGFSSNNALLPYEEKEVFYPNLSSKVFALKEPEFTFTYPDIRKEFDIHLHKNRPDLPNLGKDLSIFLKGSQEKKSVALQEKVFLSYDFEKKLHFSSEKKQFWMKPIRIEKDSIQIEVEIDPEGFSMESPSFDFSSFIISTKSPVLTEVTEGSGFGSLAQAKWWGIDRFSVIYQNRECQLHRLELMGQIFEISEGEYYICKKGTWKRTELGGESKGHPLAFIKSISPKMLEIEGWDETGSHFYSFSLPISLSKPITYRIEDLISNIHMRTLKQVSFQLGNERLIMKIGDWAAKILGKWKVLKTKEDLSEYLVNKETSDLFIFDGIDRKSHQKTLTGHLFNPMRTEAREVRIPIDYTKSSQKSHANTLSKQNSSARKEGIKKSISKISKTSKGKKK